MPTRPSPSSAVPSTPPESRQAQAALTELGGKIEALPPDHSPEPLRKVLHSLLETRCFLIASGDVEDKFDSGLSLTTWWKHGGKEWLSSVLSSDRKFVLPPSARSTLALDGKPNQPLASILCGLADPACGRQTGGWVERAEAAFAAHAARAQARRAAQSKEPRDKLDGFPRDEADCVARAEKVSPDWRYKEWKPCAKFLRPAEEALPLGRVRTPARGFFVIRGRRGHYSFCDEIRVYDLASGAAYVAQSCSNLALFQDGVVDGARTDASRSAQLVTGRLPADNLREAVWMTLLLGKVESRTHRQAYRVALPPGIEPKVPRGGSYSGFAGGGSSWRSSGQTQLDWVWLDGGRVLARGHLTWPHSDSASATHAADLLQIAEAGLQPGCPPSSLPPVRLLTGEPPGVNRRDAPFAILPVYTELWQLLGRAPRCAATQ